MDGVLVDGTEWHYEALNRALALFGFGIGRSEHHGVFDGLPTRRKLEILSDQGVLPAALHPFINEMKQRYTIDTVNALCKPTFIHQHAVRQLHRDGIAVALASNSIRDTVDLIMDKTGIAPYLSASLSASDVSRGKPDPDIYLAAAEVLGVTPVEVLAVEDNGHGFRAASAAGCHLLKVRNPGDVTVDAIRMAIRRANEAGTSRVTVDITELEA